jgi:hypothetical protein
MSNFIENLNISDQEKMNINDSRVTFSNIRKYIFENILVKLIENDNVDEIKTFVFLFKEAINTCPDGQISFLKMIYDSLYCKRTFDSFDNYILNLIAVYKNMVFALIVTPSQATQNVHVLNTLKHTMSEELGLIVEIDLGMGMYNQDPFEGSEGNVLAAFYEKFTPEYMIKIICEDLEKNNEKLLECASFVLSNLNEDYDFILQGFVFNSKIDEKLYKMCSIKQDTVERILLKMCILRKTI